MIFCVFAVVVVAFVVAAAASYARRTDVFAYKNTIDLKTEGQNEGEIKRVL